MNQDRIGEIILEGSDVRVTMLTRILVSNAQWGQAISDLQTSILRNMRVLVNAGIDEDFIGSLAALLEVSSNSMEAMSEYASATDVMVRKIHTEVYAPEASNERQPI